ncbi:MAG: gamma-glutamylcyclotransferase [Planctomycetes bacterium]|nr:gamma-glutamylcyclotransferase [Planctomycetota bacterium]MCP4770365.1 gamma-glutamylcyclotransferase [Planctomycetota bacterium]MCP4860543.1 gamma-glutamylcyclotransferase [Planctomycetota bacterium]
MNHDSESHPLFVYGTLMYPEVVHGLTGLPLAGDAARLLDYRRYSVRPPGRQGRGPIIFPEQNGVVEGRLLYEVPAAAMDLIDRFEAAGGGYRRCEVVVHLLGDENPITAWAYVGEEALREHRAGSWSTSRFETEDLEWYLNERLPVLRSAWGLPPV